MNLNSQPLVPNSKLTWVTSILLGLFGCLLVLFTTARYGAGVSGDSVDYISTADSLRHGRGFVDYSGSPYLAWPPLYPLVLAGMGWLTGEDTFSLGWLLNAVLFGVFMGLTGFLFFFAFQGSAIWLALGMLIVMLSPTLLRLASIVSTDILFMVLVVLYALLGSNYLVHRKLSALLGLSLIAGLAALVRWHGVILIIAVVFLALLSHSKNLKAGLLQAIWVGFLSSFPFGLWVIGRNYQQFGTLLGFRETNRIDYAYNLTDSVSKMIRWLFPVQLTEKISPLILFTCILLILLVINQRADWSRFFQRLTGARFLPLLIFIPIYYFFVLFTSITYEHVFLFDDRYYAPLYVFFFLILALVLDELVLQRLRRWSVFSRFRSKLPSYILSVVLLSWYAYPAYGIYKYVSISRQMGEPTYNIYNTKQYNESLLIKQAKAFDFDPETPIYSNIPAAVYFFTGMTALRSPNNWLTDLNDLEYLNSQYQNWPPSGEAYLLWFPYDADFYYSPETVSLVANLTEIYTSSDGNLYHASRK